MPTRTRPRFAFPLALAALAVSVALCGPTPRESRGELPPQTYEKLKRSATEVLILTVTNVKVTEDKNDVLSLDIKAKVDRAEKSQLGLKAGGEIRFESYYVKPAAWRKGFVGPKSPPLLKVGWHGRVHLHKSLNWKTIGPAAYGKSFEWMGDKPAPASGNAATTSPVVARTLQPDSIAVVTASSGKIMDGNRVMASIAKGEKLRIYRLRSGWAEVKAPGTEWYGWMAVESLAPWNKTKAAPPAPKETPKELAMKSAVLGIEIATLLVNKGYFQEANEYSKKSFQESEVLGQLLAQGKHAEARDTQRRFLARAEAFKRAVEKRAPR